jgi:hypothetical protein
MFSGLKKVVLKMRKIKGLKEDGSISGPWRNFKARLDLYADVPISEWNEYNFLGHILKRYKDYMGMEFSLSYIGAPSKSKELYCIKRMVLYLGSSDNQTIKDYIDFVYNSYIIPGKVSVSSLAYFFTANFMFEFKKKLRRDSKITRATKLPDSYKNILENLSIDVNTYGDLAFAKIAIDNDPGNNDLAIYSKMFNELKNIGFDDSVLGKLD